MFIVEVTHDAKEIWRRQQTQNSKATHQILSSVPGVGGKATICIPVQWPGTVTQNLINKFKEIALALEDEFKDLSAEDQLEQVVAKVSAMAVPSLFEKSPFSTYVKGTTGNNDNMRPHRPWIYDHALGGTEGCHLKESVFEKTLDWHEVMRLFGLATMLTKEGAAVK